MTAPHEQLERLFHEPSRLAILTELCANKDGLSFVDLKARCGLTDGNLNRHLHALKEASVVLLEKSFVEAKPRTTVSVTTAGRKQFLDYLAALEQMLQHAAERVGSTGNESPPRPLLFSSVKATR